MYCSNCGKEIQDGSAFCSRCGAAQTGGVGLDQSETNRRGAGYGYDMRYNTMCIIGVVLAGVSLFFSYAGLMGIGGFILSRMGFKQVAKTGERGKELAITGMVISGITAIFGIISLLVSLNVVSSISSMFSSMF